MAHKLAPSPNTARTPASPNTARTPAFTENIPAVAGQVSAIGSMNAPFIFTDWIGSNGIHGGVVNITLEAVRHMLKRLRRSAMSHASLGSPATPRSALSSMTPALPLSTPDGIPRSGASFGRFQTLPRSGSTSVWVYPTIASASARSHAASMAS